jgi:hypothetical protein
MRKATKLTPPHLPDLSVRNESTSKCQNKNKSDNDDDASWSVIKHWSENILGTQFDSIDDLAAHINTNLSPSSSSTSKQMLHKKLLQRELKDRKRNNVSNSNFPRMNYFHFNNKIFSESKFTKETKETQNVNIVIARSRIGLLFSSGWNSDKAGKRDRWKCH